MNVPEDKYPKWPEGKTGTKILEAVGLVPVDDLFKLLYVEGTFQARFNEKSLKQNYQSSGWAPSYDQLPPVSSSVPEHTQDPTTGYVRRITYSGSTMGSKFVGEDIQMIVSAKHGKEYIVEICVSTTAPYGDKFRVLIRQRLWSLEPEGRKTQLAVHVVPVYVAKVNGLVKSLIEKGLKDGTTKNYSIAKEVMAEFVRMEEIPSRVVIPAPHREVEGIHREEGEEEEEEGEEEYINYYCRVFLGQDLLLHASRWLAWIQHSIMGQPSAVPIPLLAALVATVAFLGVSRIVIDIFLFILYGSQSVDDRISVIVRALFAFCDPPKTVNQLLTSFAILVLVRSLSNSIIRFLPLPPPLPGDGGVVEGEAPVASARGGHQRGTTDIHPKGEGMDGVQEDYEGIGIKYEGYSEALSKVADRFQKGAAGFGQAMRALNKFPSKHLSRKHVERLTSFSASSQKRKEKEAILSKDHQLDSSLKMVTRGHIGHHPHVHHHLGGGRHQHKKKHRHHVKQRSRSKEHFHQMQVEGGTRTPDESTTPRSCDLGSRSRCLSEGSSPLHSPKPGGVHGGIGIECDVGSCFGGGDAMMSDDIHMDQPPLPSPRKSSKWFGLRSSMAHKAPEDGVNWKKIIEVNSDGEVCTCSPRTTDSSEGIAPSRCWGGEGGGGGGEQGSPLQKTPHSEEIKGDQDEVETRYLQGVTSEEEAFVSPFLAARAIREEVFENERLQPFRGWGHSWPGHFLPTDKVYHWSQGRSSVGVRGNRTSQDFRAAAPLLPEGWEWVEPKWQLDVSGILTDSVDIDGWSYGLDFHKLSYPFPKGSGHKGLTDFVRRRRFYRTRVPKGIPKTPPSEEAGYPSHSSCEENGTFHEPSTYQMKRAPALEEVEGMDLEETRHVGKMIEKEKEEEEEEDSLPRYTTIVSS